MIFRVEWSEAAVGDAARILDYLYARGNTAAADGLLRDLQTRIGALTQMPERGRIVPELRDEGITKYRELVDLAPYRIIYSVEGERVAVLVVVDGRQDLSALLHDRLLRPRR